MEKAPYLVKDKPLSMLREQMESMRFILCLTHYLKLVMEPHRSLKGLVITVKQFIICMELVRMMEMLNKLVQLMPIIKAGLQKNLRSLVELNLLVTTTYLRDKIRSIKCVGILMHRPPINTPQISDGPKS